MAELYRFLGQELGSSPTRKQRRTGSFTGSARRKVAPFRIISCLNLSRRSRLKRKHLTQTRSDGWDENMDQFSAVGSATVGTPHSGQRTCASTADEYF